MATQVEIEAGENYQQRFLSLLNNRGKSQKGGDLTGRRHGFVVFVRGSSNLKLIQSLCFDTRQSWNTCLTARYRLRSGPIFGTLFAAFLADLQQIQQGNTSPQISHPIPGNADIRGDLFPAADEPEWQKLVRSPLDSLIAEWPPETHGILDPDLMEKMLKLLSNESTLSSGMRLVLLGEVDKVDEDRSEWDLAQTDLWPPRLPERVGLVLAGAPEDIQLPGNDPHFLEFVLPAGEPSDEAPTDVEKSQRFKPASLHSDLPATEDQLNVNGYAQALARFVLHSQTKPPLTLGIHGPWGKGKSSFMQLVDIALVKWAAANRGKPAQMLADLQSELEGLETETESASEEEIKKHLSALEDKKAAYQRSWKKMQHDAEKEVLTVNFNAWQFEDARQIWAGLASVISERLERSLSGQSRLWMRLAYTWHKRRAELLLNLLLPVLIALLTGILVLGSGIESLQKLFFENADIAEKLAALLLPAGSTLILFWFVGWRIFKVVQPVSERMLGYVQLPNYREQMGYQHRVMDDLRFAYNHLQRRWPQCRVVVYIDDLDRCSEEKIMEILQAINLILGSSQFFVFLGMDTEMIYRAIRAYYRKNQKDDPLPPDFPENYLRKIVQLSFHLPEAPAEQRFAYLSNLFSATARHEFARRADGGKKLAGGQESQITAVDGRFSYDLSLLLKPVQQDFEDVEDTADELAAFQDYQKFLEDNPREIKRLVNVHRLVKILLQHQETSWSAERQRKLVKWLIFCATWPDLVDELLTTVRETPQSHNCLEQLIEKLTLDNDTLAFDQLREFAMHKDVLACEDIDADFSLAAYISQMVREESQPDNGTSKQPT